MKDYVVISVYTYGVIKNGTAVEAPKTMESVRAFIADKSTNEGLFKILEDDSTLLRVLPSDYLGVDFTFVSVPDDFIANLGDVSSDTIIDELLKVKVAKLERYVAFNREKHPGAYGMFMPLNKVKKGLLN